MGKRCDPSQSTTRRAFLGGGLAIALAGCLESSAEGNGEVSPRPADDVGSFEDILEEPTVPLARPLSEYADAAADSTASTDSIPAIDDPTIIEAGAEASLLDEESVVFGVEIDGVARAYPHLVLVHHEIINDTLGGTPLALTYCPLTGTAIAFERGDTVFGVEGWLINSNLILFDRNTDSWWPQILGTAVDGALEGYSLPEVRVVWTTWGRWRETYPETTVVTDETDYIRSYGDDPYGLYNPEPVGGYYVSSDLLYPVLSEDDRLHPKEIVMGSRTRDGAVAFRKDTLRETELLTAELTGSTSADGVPYLAVYHSQLDTGFVYRNPEEESYVRRSDGYEGPDGTVHAADALPLESVNTFDAMWFAWYAFYPETALVT